MKQTDEQQDDKIAQLEAQVTALSAEASNCKKANNDSLKVNACAFGGFVIAGYLIYVGGTLASGLPMPDGVYISAVIGTIALAFGYKFKALAGVGQQPQQ